MIKEFELEQRLIDKIEQLKKQRNAVILAHNYQSPDIQDLADITGDSLGLSKQAAQTKADVIVFCGVMFMAETAAILSPEKAVLIPEKTAGCPMADMITAEQLAQLKQQHPDALVVCYVNSPVEVKALSDYCCTSSNAVEVVSSLDTDRPVIFVPDQHLGSYVREKTGRDMILWPGYCPSHVVITEKDIQDKRKQYPRAQVIAHPECSEPVKDAVDALLSTGQMLSYVENSKADTFIVATEVGMLHALAKVRPDARFVPASDRAVCPNMKKTTIDKIIDSMEHMQHRVTVDKAVADKARGSLTRMIEILPK